MEIAKQAERVITIEDGKIIKDEKNLSQKGKENEYYKQIHNKEFEEE